MTHEMLAPFRELLVAMTLSAAAIPLAMLVYAAGVRLYARALLRRQLYIAEDLGVDELALAACETHREQMLLIHAKLLEAEALYLMHPTPGRDRVLLSHRRWVNEWLWNAAS